MRAVFIFALVGVAAGREVDDTNPFKQFIDNTPFGAMMKAGQEQFKTQMVKNAEMLQKFQDNAYKMPADYAEGSEDLAPAPAPSFVEKDSVERCAAFDCPEEYKMRKGYAALECGNDCMTTCCKPCSGSCWKKHVALVQKKQKRRHEEAETEALEEKVARLEARVKELEENGSAASDVEAPSMMSWLGKLFQNKDESENSESSDEETLREEAEDMEEKIEEQEDGPSPKASLHRKKEEDDADDEPPAVPPAAAAVPIEPSNIHPFSDFVKSVAIEIGELKKDQKEGHRLNMQGMAKEKKRLKPLKDAVDQWAKMR